MSHSASGSGRPAAFRWSTPTISALLDAGSFGTIGALLVVCLTSEMVWSRFPAISRSFPDLDRLELRTNAAKLIWACVVGAHLGNYFLSGLAKLRAGGAEPWTWLVGNPTQTAIVIGMERGDNPLATIPWLVQFSWDAIKNFGLLFNAFVLGAQLLCPAGLGSGTGAAGVHPAVRRLPYRRVLHAGGACSTSGS